MENGVASGEALIVTVRGFSLPGRATRSSGDKPSLHEHGCACPGSTDPAWLTRRWGLPGAIPGHRPSADGTRLALPMEQSVLPAGGSVSVTHRPPPARGQRRQTGHACLGSCACCEQTRGCTGQASSPGTGLPGPSRGVAGSRTSCAWSLFSHWLG